MMTIGRLTISRGGIAIAAPRPSAIGIWLARPEARALLTRRLAMIWVAAAGLVGMLRMLLAPAGTDPLVGPYVLVALLPGAALYFGYRIIRLDPDYRFKGLSLTGRWVPVSAATSRAHPLYGNDGLLVMLSGGLLFSILVRAFDFYVGMPALFPGAPVWFAPVYALMLGDMLMLSVLYALCFAAMLKHSPLFPLLLALTWIADVCMLGAGYLLFEGWPLLPHDVEMGLTLLLSGNIKKAMISIALWAPYLLLSRRANVTFLRRVRPDDLVLARRWEAARSGAVSLP